MSDLHFPMPQTLASKQAELQGLCTENAQLRSKVGHASTSDSRQVMENRTCLLDLSRVLKLCSVPMDARHRDMYSAQVAVVTTSDVIIRCDVLYFVSGCRKHMLSYFCMSRFVAAVLLFLLWRTTKQGIIDVCIFCHGCHQECKSRNISLRLPQT